MSEPTNHLCTLVVAPINGKGFIPYARSYNGNQWEAYAGEYSSLKPSCRKANDGGRVCTIPLPTLETGYQVVLTSYVYDLPPMDEAARFLEKTTFGATRAEISALVTDSSPVAWLQNQFEMKAIGSHRRFWREAVGEWHEFASSTVGLYGSPCQSGARYRRFAFVKRDRQRSLLVEGSGSGLVTLSVGKQYGTEAFQVRTQVKNVTLGDKYSPGSLLPDRR